MLIRVTPDILVPAEAIASVASSRAGAINIFLGVVRDNNLGRSVNYLDYEAYPTMAEKVMREIAEESVVRFGFEDVAVLHRTGRLEIGETSLLIAVSSGHRAESFEGGHWLVNEIKKRVPVWKKEVWADGESWVEGPESLGMQAPSHG
ncbi:MAG: molybdenum cofactor biosynthesis protein MoaE [Tepidiformaceae bacterium]